MTDQYHIAGICGSLRDESKTRIALRYALDAAGEMGPTTELIDLREYDLPIFHPDLDDPGDAPQLTAAIRQADAVILGTPMYHGSYSSPLKTALDYSGFDEFENKTVGLLGISGGSFPILALEHLRSVCRALNAWVIPHQAAVPRAYDQIANGKITNTDIQKRVEVLGQRAVQFVNIEPDPKSFEGNQNVGAAD